MPSTVTQRPMTSLVKTLPTEWIRQRMRVTESGCWEWTGGLSRDGYGQATIGTGSQRRNVRAHRFSYEAFIGAIPDGREIDHLCFNRACVNPEHLEAVTHTENIRRSHLKDFCAKGHPMAGSNLAVWAGRRYCRACRARRRRVQPADIDPVLTTEAA